MWEMLATLAQQGTGSGLEQLGNFARPVSTLPSLPAAANAAPAFPAAATHVAEGVQPVLNAAANAVPALPGAAVQVVPQDALTRQLIEAQNQLNATYGTWTKTISDFIRTQGVALALWRWAPAQQICRATWRARV